MSKDQLFTALDISNETKKVFPQVRHRDVREVVRTMFDSDMEPNGYARSDIKVTLVDGSQPTALLYYPLSASWDLESLYDNQKRSQVSNKVAAPAAVDDCAAPAVVQAVLDALSQPANAAAVMATGAVNTVVDVADAVASNAVNTAHDLWKNLFQNQPSLFPRK